MLVPHPNSLGGSFKRLGAHRRTGDEALRVAYNQSPETLGKDAYLLTNPSDASGFAEGYETRLSQKGRRIDWELAVTRYRAVTRTAPGNGPRQNDWSELAKIGDPNESINAYSSTFFDRGLGARFWGLPPALGYTA